MKTIDMEFADATYMISMWGLKELPLCQIHIVLHTSYNPLSVQLYRSNGLEKGHTKTWKTLFPEKGKPDSSRECDTWVILGAANYEVSRSRFCKNSLDGRRNRNSGDHHKAYNQTTVKPKILIVHISRQAWLQDMELIKLPQNNLRCGILGRSALQNNHPRDHFSLHLHLCSMHQV